MANSLDGHQARKRFGQNFLHDPHVISRIVSAITSMDKHLPNGGTLVEIGPGQGAITEHLIAHYGSLDVIEIDNDLIQYLGDTFGDAIRIHPGDVLAFDFNQFTAEDKPLRIVGNLPYNISTPLLFHVLQHATYIHDMVFMLQKEVVDRMAATPGNKTYGRLSVMLAWYCQVQPLFKVSKGAFNPPPKVESAIVRLLPHRTPPFVVNNEKRFAAIVAQAFNQRRKTLRKSLASLVDDQGFIEADIDPSLRAEQLSPAQFAQLSNTQAP